MHTKIDNTNQQLVITQDKIKIVWKSSVWCSSHACLPPILNQTRFTVKSELKGKWELWNPPWFDILRAYTSLATYYTNNQKKNFCQRLARQKFLGTINASGQSVHAILTWGCEKVWKRLLPDACPTPAYICRWCWQSSKKIPVHIWQIGGLQGTACLA